MEATDVEIDPTHLIRTRLFRGTYDTGHDDSGVTGKATPGFYDDVEVIDIKVFPEIVHDGSAVFFLGLCGLEVGRGESASDVDALQVDVLAAEIIKQFFDLRDCSVPLADVSLLRTDVKCDAVGDEPERQSFEGKAIGHAGVASELSGKRPVGAFAVHEYPEIDERSGRMFCDAEEVFLGIGGEQLDPNAMRERNVGRLLDGVSVGDTISGNPEAEHLLDFGTRRHIEVASLGRDFGDDFIERAGFHCVVDARARHGSRKPVIGEVDSVEVDHEERRLLTCRERAGPLEAKLIEQISDTQFIFHVPSCGKEQAEFPADLCKIVPYFLDLCKSYYTQRIRVICIKEYLC